MRFSLAGLFCFYFDWKVAGVILTHGIDTLGRAFGCLVLFFILGWNKKGIEVIERSSNQGDQGGEKDYDDVDK